MKPIDMKDNAYINSGKEVNYKDPKFQVGDYARTSKNKNIFAKEHTPNWSEEVFVIKKVKNTVRWTYVVSDSMVKKLLEHFMKNNFKKQTNKLLRYKKLLKEKENKLYVKWKGYDNSFNGWIDKNDLE